MTTAAKEPTEVLTLTWVPFERVKPNPWQPRAEITPESVRTLADSIYLEGLHHYPKGRPSPAGDDTVELQHGHRRLEAMKLLHSEGKWTRPAAPVVIAMLDDREMAMGALSENRQRKDVTPLEEYRAWQRALQTVKGLTVEELAKSVSLGRSTVANCLRILALPKVVLERVESGELSAHAAREFLCLMNEDHCHEDDMASVVADIANTHGWQGAPDFRVANVREQIRARVWSNEERWRPLDSQQDSSDLTSSYESGGGARQASFDVDEFVMEHPELVHSIPSLKADKARRWTCDAREWRRRQTMATREANAKVADAGLKPAEIKGDIHQQHAAALALDPVVRRVSLETAALAAAGAGGPTSPNCPTGATVWLQAISREHPLHHIVDAGAGARCGQVSGLKGVMLTAITEERLLATDVKICDLCRKAMPIRAVGSPGLWLQKTSGMGTRYHIVDQGKPACGMANELVGTPRPYAERISLPVCEACASVMAGKGASTGVNPKGGGEAGRALLREDLARTVREDPAGWRKKLKDFEGIFERLALASYGLDKFDVQSEIRTFVQAVDAGEAFQVKSVAKGKLSDDARKLLGTRGEELLNLSRNRPSFVERLSGGSVPPWLDVKECLEGCVKGARYAFTQGDKPSLHCFNQKCWNGRLAAARAVYTERLGKRISAEDAEDQALADKVRQGLGAGAARQVALALLPVLDLSPLRPHDAGHSSYEFEYQPACGKRLRELFKVKAGDNGRGRWLSYGGVQHTNEGFRKLVEGLSGDRVVEVASQMVAWSVRKQAVEGARAESGGW